MQEKKANGWALIPALVFLVFYLGLGIVLEYVLKIEMGFYQVPVVVVFLLAVGVACLQNRSISFDRKMGIMAEGVGDKNIFTMILIFLLAGIFVGVTGRDSAQTVAYYLLTVAPAQWSVAALFVAACFVSTAMGTSVGTITLLAPVGVAAAQASGFSPALCVGAVMGGAMFGDNLSFISDTTIAACSTQGCAMRDKFRSNFGIALPAAILTLVLTVVVCMRVEAAPVSGEAGNALLLIPYVLVLITGIAGCSVFISLLLGIISASVIGLLTSATTPLALLGNMGGGVSGMYETILVTILVSALCALIRENGGFAALLHTIHKLAKGNRGGQLGIGLLVLLMDIVTANNTVAIVMAAPIAKQMSEEYGIEPKRTASLLDTFSCIGQGALPYGAQMLVALSAAAEMGVTLSAFDVLGFLFYPGMLAICSLIYIALSGGKVKKAA